MHLQPRPDAPATRPPLLVVRRRLAVAGWLGLLLALAACATPTPTPPGTPALVRLLATDLSEPLAYDLALAYAEVNAGVLVAPARESAARLAGELRAGRGDLALTVEAGAGQFATPVGYLPLHVVVHPDNPAQSLTVEQAQDLFAGRARDWSAVSGGQGDVYVAAREAGSEADTFFGEQLWGEAPVEGAGVTANARLAPTWGAMRELVGGNRGLIGYLIGPELADFVRPVPLITAAGESVEWRALIVAAAAREPDGPARDFLAWVQSPAGQAVVAARHQALEP